MDAYEKTVHSQFGEDGVLEKIFEIIPPTHRYAVEFGAYDGVTNSNTRYFISDLGWSSYQIEGNPNRAKKLAELYKDNDKVVTQHAWIYPGNIEYLFERAGVPTDLDLLIIDIDSNDYWVWKAIKNYRPKVVMIEANHNFPPPQLAVVEYNPFTYYHRDSRYFGASMESLYRLGKRKGYELVHQMATGPNLIFVDAKYYSRFGLEDNTPVKMFRPRRSTPMPLSEAISDPNGRDSLAVDAFEIKKRWLLDY